MWIIGKRMLPPCSRFNTVNHVHCAMLKIGSWCSLNRNLWDLFFFAPLLDQQHHFLINLRVVHCMHKRVNHLQLEDVCSLIHQKYYFSFFFNFIKLIPGVCCFQPKKNLVIQVPHLIHHSKVSLWWVFEKFIDHFWFNIFFCNSFASICIGLYQFSSTRASAPLPNCTNQSFIFKTPF